jgi:dTDP-4-amino-4,6-dideoxygalactose transaminase
MELLGWKYNMTNIQGALLLNQLTRIEELLGHRERLSQNYERAFSGVKGIELLEVLPGVKSARHLFTILVALERRDSIMHALQEQGVGVAVNFRPIHLMKYYRKKYGYTPHVFPNAEYIGARTITLPLYPSLSEAEQKYVIETVLSVVRG